MTVSHAPGRTTVRVSLVKGNLSVKWAVKAFPSRLAEGVREARLAAQGALVQLEEAVGEEA